MEDVSTRGISDRDVFAPRMDDSARHRMKDFDFAWFTRTLGEDGQSWGSQGVSIMER